MGDIFKIDLEIYTLLLFLVITSIGIYMIIYDQRYSPEYENDNYGLVFGIIIFIAGFILSNAVIYNYKKDKFKIHDILVFCSGCVIIMCSIVLYHFVHMKEINDDDNNKEKQTALKIYMPLLLLGISIVIFFIFSFL